MDAEQPHDTTTQAEQPGGPVVDTHNKPRPENAITERSSTESKDQASTKIASSRNRGLRLFGAGALLVAGTVGGALWFWPHILLALHTVSTDDAYVAGHVNYSS